MVARPSFRDVFRIMVRARATPSIRARRHRCGRGRGSDHHRGRGSARLPAPGRPGRGQHKSSGPGKTQLRGLIALPSGKWARTGRTGRGEVVAYAALITWFAAVLLGLYMLAVWLIENDVTDRDCRAQQAA